MRDIDESQITVHTPNGEFELRRKRSSWFTHFIIAVTMIVMALYTLEIIGPR